MSLEKHIIISSEDKDDSSSNSNSDFVVNLAEKYYTQNILKVLVSEVTVPNVFPNIRGADYGTSQNNLLSVSTGAPPISINIPEGQYLLGSVTPSLDFVTVFTNQINTAIAPATIAINYNELTNKLEFTMTGSDLQIFGSSSTPPLTATASQILINDAIGIGANGLFLPDGVATSAPFQVDLSGFQNVYVHSKEVALSHAIDGDTGLISVVSPVSLADAPFGGFAYRQNNDDELASIQYDQVRNLSRISIILRDNLGNKLDIGTHKMNVVLKCYLDSG
jgi:hypothetical protein